jgi:hypothetical protein
MHVGLKSFIVLCCNSYLKLFKVGTFTNSTNISSHELLKPTCILRYELQHNTIKLLKPTCILRYELQHNTIKLFKPTCILRYYDIKP